MRNPGRMLFAEMIATLVVIGAIAVGIWDQVAYRSAQRAEACLRTVASREDNRAMWLWLTDQFPQAELTDDALDELNTRLPSLTCVDNQPVPIEDVP